MRLMTALSELRVAKMERDKTRPSDTQQSIGLTLRPHYEYDEKGQLIFRIFLTIIEFLAAKRSLCSRNEINDCE